MDFEKEEIKRSSGVAKAGLATGITGTGLGAINAISNLGLAAMELIGRNKTNGASGMPYIINVGDSFGGNCGDKATKEDIATTKELMAKDLEIAQLNTEVKLRDSTIYTDSKSLDLYRYIDGKLNEITSQLAAQEVKNQATKDSFQVVNERLGYVKSELETKICCESKERKCADNAIINYSNATFYPKQVADVTTGTTTTAQMLYNPLPTDNCCC